MFDDFKVKPKLLIEDETSVWLYAVDPKEQQWATKLDPNELFCRLMLDNYLEESKK